MASSAHVLQDAQAEWKVIRGIGRVRVRPLSPGDWDAFCAFGRRLARDDLRLRFAGPVNLDEGRCRRLFEIDHARQEALAAFGHDGALLGIGRLARSAGADAEVALIVRSDLQGRGLGRLLLDCVIHHARQAEVRSLLADILYENRIMLGLAQRAGFGLMGSGGPMVRARLDLEAPATPRPLSPPPPAHVGEVSGFREGTSNLPHHAP